MKTLILARHAKSSWKDPGQSDHDRPLNKRGRHDAPRMAAHLAANWPAPQAMVTSTARRARDTTAALAEGFCYPAGAIRELPRLYLADAATLLDVARNLPDGEDTVLLVGHNPGMTDFVNRLCNAGLDNLPSCGVARIVFDVTTWTDLQPGGGRLAALEVPKALPDD